MDLLFFIHMSRNQPSAHDFAKVYGAVVTGATAGVTAGGFSGDVALVSPIEPRQFEINVS